MKCKCGCGTKLIGKQKLWASKLCRSRWTNKRYRKKGRVGHSEAMKGNQFASMEHRRRINNRERGDHLFTYCIQAEGQCARYDDGFNIDNLEGGCFGRNYTGDCYKTPIKISQRKGLIMGKINLPILW